MFTVARLLDISGVSRSEGLADILAEFHRGAISVTAVAPITGIFTRVANSWDPDQQDMTFIVAPRMEKISCALLEAVVEVFFIEQCEPRSETIREYLQVIYGLDVSAPDIISLTMSCTSLYVQGSCIYPSLVSQQRSRREHFAHYPHFDDKNINLLVDTRLVSLAEFFISHFSGQHFSAIQFSVLTKLYGPEPLGDAPAGLSMWFYERALSMGHLMPLEFSNSVAPPKIRVINIVPVGVDIEADDVSSPVVSAEKHNDDNALLREQLLFVHCFKNELLAGQSVLLNQVNNLCRVRSGTGAQIDFKTFGFQKLRDFLEEIPGVVVHGDKHNMAVRIDSIHAFAAFISDVRECLGGESTHCGIVVPTR
jgi:hypothetical protein